MKRGVLGSFPRMACREKWRVVVTRIVGVWAENLGEGCEGRDRGCGDSEGSFV